MNPNCPDILKKLTPMSRVVAASAIDVYEDIGKVQQLFFHWGARGLKKLQSETLKSGKRSALITINQNTRTASLPADFDSELFIGYIKNGIKIPIPLKGNLINTDSITEIPCEDTCEKCGQNSTACNDLTVTESTELIVVNDALYEKTTIKKLYPDGNYYLEVTYPYWDMTNEVIAYATTKEYIATIDLKDCGCINPTVENIETIKANCYDCYCNHYAPCSNICDRDAGGYNIFEEKGLIQFDFNFRHKQVYIEYLGFIPKLNGQLAVPEVAFETLVEYIKAMSIDGKKSVSNPDKAWRWNRYSIERKAMVKKMNRLSLDQILYAINLTPKFDWTAPSWNNFCPLPDTDVITVTNASITDCEINAVSCSTVPSTQSKITPFQIAVKVPAGVIDGLPVDGQSTYQNNALKNGLNLEYIIVSNNIFSKQLGQFTFDSAAGTIDISPNQWVTGDVLIANYNKLV